jgi:hypothetical protein
MDSHTGTGAGRLHRRPRNRVGRRLFMSSALLATLQLFGTKIACREAAIRNWLRCRRAALSGFGRRLSGNRHRDRSEDAMAEVAQPEWARYRLNNVRMTLPLSITRCVMRPIPTGDSRARRLPYPNHAPLSRANRWSTLTLSTASAGPQPEPRAGGPARAVAGRPTLGNDTSPAPQRPASAASSFKTPMK